MATYAELAAIQDDPGWSSFRQKVAVACTVKAQDLIAQATPTAAQVDWAVNALAAPLKTSDDLIWYVIAANNGVSIAVIMGASDSAIQNNVDAAVDKITSAL